MLRAFPPYIFMLTVLGDIVIYILETKNGSKFCLPDKWLAQTGGGLLVPNHPVLSGNPSPPAVTSETQEGARPGDSLLSAGRDFFPKAQVGQGSPPNIPLTDRKTKVQ